LGPSGLGFLGVQPLGLPGMSKVAPELIGTFGTRTSKGLASGTSRDVQGVVIQYTKETPQLPLTIQL